MRARERCCGECEFSRPAYGLSRVIAICQNKAGLEKKWYVVRAGGSCANFQFKKAYVSVQFDEGMRFIPLTRGKFAMVDAEDHEWLDAYNIFYAVRTTNRSLVRMHREITRAPKGLVVDHIDHDGFNNRRSNLRVSTDAEHLRHQRPRKSGTSKCKGVHLREVDGRYHACITKGGMYHYIGGFRNEIAAEKTYEERAKELFGEFAYPNFGKK